MYVLILMLVFILYLMLGFILYLLYLRLFNHSDDIDSRCELTTDLSQLKIEEDSNLTTEELSDLFFHTLDLKEYEKQITDQYILDLSDAKKVYVCIQNWLKEAQNYYTLETMASDYIEIVQDQSQMYERLLFFDENQENQAKYIKRSADLLEAVLKEINPNYYKQYCRQMWLKLGQLYADMLEIKVCIYLLNFQ